MIPHGRRILEIGIALALIYTAAVWIGSLVSGGGLSYALWWWFPGIFVLIGTVALLTKMGERRNRIVLGVSTIYAGVIIYISIWYQEFVSLLAAFVVGAGLVTGLTLLLVRASIVNCPHCGVANPEKHDYCHKCGNKLRP